MFNLDPTDREIIKLDRVRARQFRNGHDLSSRVGQPLKIHEQCRILRWREGMTLQYLADVMIISKVSLIRYERGEWNFNTLVDWWKKNLKG